MSVQAAYVDHISRNSWARTVGEIDELLDEHTTGNLTSGYSQGITKSHWVSNNERPNCIGCNLKFSFTERLHHCRRCGEAFCNRCINYQRRLNHLANPDPNGKLYKVCQKCFDTGPQTIGFLYSWKETFKAYRDTNCGIGGDGSSLYGRLNILKELERIKEGFRASINNNTSPVGKTLLDIKSLVVTPDWQKSRFWAKEQLSPRCRRCNQDFGLLRSKNSCVVCGHAVCGSCSNKELIVYVLNDAETQDVRQDRQDVQVSIIKIVGCPEKEPDICLYLRLCLSCAEYVKDVQVRNYHQRELKVNHDDLIWKPLVLTVTNLRETQKRIDEQLPIYQELIEGLQISSRAPRSLPKNQNNMQILAKAQADLSDHFTSLVLGVQELKKVRPQTNGQSKLLRNITKSKCAYYMENMSSNRELHRKLGETASPETLEAIQEIVDKNSINSGYLSLKQLLFEVLHLCTKHNFKEDILKSMMSTEEVLQKELERCIRSSGEDWEEHNRCINQLLQIQLKGHKLIRPSRRLTKQYGEAHILDIMCQRSSVITQQIFLQLCAKTPDKRFKASKEALETLNKYIVGYTPS